MDGRKKNGNKGHSTKSKGVDKRKNPFKQAVESAISDDELIKVIKMLYNKAITDGDVNAAKEVLNRCLGKSIETTIVDISTDRHVFSEDDLDDV
jgi:hypothetical protein